MSEKSCLTWGLTRIFAIWIVLVNAPVSRSISAARALAVAARVSNDSDESFPPFGCMRNLYAVCFVTGRLFQRWSRRARAFPLRLVGRCLHVDASRLDGSW